MEKDTRLKWGRSQELLEVFQCMTVDGGWVEGGLGVVVVATLRSMHYQSALFGCLNTFGIWHIIIQSQYSVLVKWVMLLLLFCCCVEIL